MRRLMCLSSLSPLSTGMTGTLFWQSFLMNSRTLNLQPKDSVAHVNQRNAWNSTVFAYKKEDFVDLFANVSIVWIK